MDRKAVQERFGILGRSSGIHKVIDRTRLVARTDITVLIEGESGVGKELIAQAIHGLSLRRHRPLKVINTGAIPEGLIESELFGAEKGAYTGATERRRGLFEEADGGSVFLDEIGEMPQAAQVRLLRVLETGTFNRVGSTMVRTSDARIIAATNKNLGQEVEAGRFREDLYYRLSTVIITVPPLRDRKEDIQPLFDSFLYHLNQKYQSPRRQLTPDAVDLLNTYRWPGNVRELRNVAEQVVVLHRGQDVDAAHLRPLLRGVSAQGASTALIPVTPPARGAEPTQEMNVIYRALVSLRMELSDLREEFRSVVGRSSEALDVQPAQSGPRTPSLPALGEGTREITYEIESEGSPEPEPEIPTLQEAEHDLIRRALQIHSGNRRETAAALGISPRTLYRKLKELNGDTD